MAEFKPGDVVLCRFDKHGKHGENIEFPVIIGNAKPWAGMVTVGAILEDGEWIDMRDGGSWEEENTRLHPDPDLIWADFCKWKLTNASD